MKYIMQYYKIGIGVGCALLVFTIGLRFSLYGENMSVRSARRLEKLFRKYELAVVMFYEKTKDHRNAIKKSLRVFNAASSIFAYKEADIVFITANLAERKLSQLQLEYDIKQLPTYMLFSFGFPVRDKNGTIVRLTGMVSLKELRNFIDSHFGDRIEDILEEEKEARKRHREYVRERAYRYPFYGYGYPYYPYYYWSYPYYGYYGYPYGGIGFGFSFGGHRHHGGHHRGHHGGGHHHRGKR